MLDLGIWVIISAIVGAKLLLLAVDFDYFRQRPAEIFSLVRTGGIFYGGLILAVAVAVWYVRRHELPVWDDGRRDRAGDRARLRGGAIRVPVRRVLLRRARRRCRGASRSTTTSRASSSARRSASSLHPTQLYEAGAALVILAVLLPPSAAGGRFADGRSGSTAHCTPSRASSSSSSAATIAACCSGCPHPRRSPLVLLPVSIVMLVRLARGRRQAPVVAAAERPRRLQPSGSGKGTLTRRTSRTMTRHEFTVGVEAAGTRLDLFLAGAVPGQSRSQIQRLIREGQVRLGDRQARANTILRAGETSVVEVPPPRPRRPNRSRCPSRSSTRTPTSPWSTSRPAWWSTRRAGHPGGTLVNALLHHLDDLSGIGGEERPGIVHRLDRGTSGLMVVAKHDRSHRELSRQFHDREVEKEYVALVWGEVHAGRRIDLPIGRDPHNRQKMSARARRARTAVTRVTASERIGGLTLVKRGHRDRPHAPDPRAPERRSATRSSVTTSTAACGGTWRRIERPVLRLERPFLHAARLGVDPSVRRSPAGVHQPAAAGPGAIVLDDLRARAEGRSRVPSRDRHEIGVRSRPDPDLVTPIL